jgi:hypothetical protein
MADSELADLTNLTTADDSDLLYIVHDPAGTPSDRKITKANLLSGLSGGGGGTIRTVTMKTTDGAYAMSTVYNPINGSWWTMCADDWTDEAGDPEVRLSGVFADGVQVGDNIELTMYDPSISTSFLTVNGTIPSSSANPAGILRSAWTAVPTTRQNGYLSVRNNTAGRGWMSGCWFEIRYV